MITGPSPVAVTLRTSYLPSDRSFFEGFRPEPGRGLLGRWLERNELPMEAALLLDELNRRIEDSDAAIGPSYLMDKQIYARPDGLERVWQYELMPLLEDLFYGQRDLAEQYGLASLRKAVAAAPAEPGP
jgi:5-methylcytosine-specific restriction enzyme B